MSTVMNICRRQVGLNQVRALGYLRRSTLAGSYAVNMDVNDAIATGQEPRPVQPSSYSFIHGKQDMT